MHYQLHSDLSHPPCSSKSHCLCSILASLQQQDVSFSLSLTNQGWTVCTGDLETRDDQDEPTLGDEQADDHGKEQAVQAWEDEQAAVAGDGGDALLQASFLLPVRVLLGT